MSDGWPPSPQQPSDSGFPQPSDSGFPQDAAGSPPAWGPGQQGAWQDPSLAYAPPGGHHGGAPPNQNSRVVLIVVAAALVMVGAIAAVVVAGSQSGQDEGADPTPAGEEISVFDLAVGQCLTLDQEAAEIDSVGLIGCEQPHTAEVYAVVRHPAPIGQSYPGAEAVNTFADEECLAAFADYVGVRYEVSEIFSTSLTPTELSWGKSGDREVVCLLISGDGSPLDPGSLRDAGI